MSKTQLKPRINASYYDFIPRPNDEDRRKLKESIIKDGVQIPIIVNSQGFILDGHTRYEICVELEIESTIPIETKRFSNETEERKFVVTTNLARRHLNKFQKIELSCPLFEIEKKRAEERIKSQGGSNQKGVSRRYGLKKEGNAAVLFGQKIKVGKTLISQANYLRQNASAELLQRCRNNEISIGKAYDLLRGLRLMPSGKKPKKAITFCPQCSSKTKSPKRAKCHVHKWFCCKVCRWGL